MPRRFNIIVADPPWPFRDQLRMSKVRRGAAANYPTLTVEEIEALPVGEWAAADAVIALWVPASRICEGLSVMQNWGFEQDQLYVWIKTTKAGRPKMGMGRRFRACKEIALIGFRGRRLPVAGKSELDVCLAPNLGHSRKPEALQDSLDRMYPRGRRLELFARRRRRRWLCVGNDPNSDTPGMDIRTWTPAWNPEWTPSKGARK